MKNKPNFLVKFFREPFSGKEPVREWLRELTAEEREIIGHDLLVIQYRWPSVYMPRVRNLGKGFWELRSTFKNRIARIIFIVIEQKIICLHAFIKKTEKINIKDLEIAQKRFKIIEQEEIHEYH